MNRWILAALIASMFWLQASAVWMRPVQAQEAAPDAAVAAASQEAQKPIPNRRHWSPYLVAGIFIALALRLLLLNR